MAEQAVVTVDLTYVPSRRPKHRVVHVPEGSSAEEIMKAAVSLMRSEDKYGLLTSVRAVDYRGTVIMDQHLTENPNG